ncbi:MAG: DUF86 domain-containing protein [Planctomycetota bacterium]
MSIDIATLIDIRAAIDRALAFVAGMDFDAFLVDNKTRWAVCSQIMVIGEAATRISKRFQEQSPGVPWGEMVGMRNRLIHGYDDIKWKTVWDTVIEDLPKLKAAIEPLIPKEP